jgi:drug/metabolite transporter (DMT)-like permease
MYHTIKPHIHHLHSRHRTISPHTSYTNMDARIGVSVAFVAAFLIRCIIIFISLLFTPSAFATAACFVSTSVFSFGKALQKAASQDLPVLSLVSITAYLCHTKWLLGIAGDIGGGALTLVALAYAPISIVQPVMCSGMGMSALIAAFYLHETIAPPDWFSTFLILLGRHYSPPPSPSLPPTALML